MARSLALAVFVLAMTSLPASAQDRGAFGITMGYPASIGAIWHVTDRVAIRPEVSLTQLSNATTSTVYIMGPGGTILASTTTQSTTDQWTVGVGASALFYVKQWDALRAYVTPRYQYSRATISASATNSGSVQVLSQPDFTSNTHFISGSFGVQYALGTRFGLYGELGLGYSHAATDTTAPGAGRSTTNTVGTRSGVGVLFYF